MNKPTKIWGRMLWLTVVAVVVVYLAVLAIVYFAQPRMLYFPTRTIQTTPTHIGLAYEEVDFAAADGIKLHGWFIPSDSARATLLFCHGNAGNISDRLASIEQFHRLRLDVFAFDYRGYGKSEGAPNETGTYRDVEAAWQYLTEQKRIPADRIVVFGRSLGGAVAIWLAAHHQPGGLIVESSFTSIPDIAAKHYPFLPVRWLSRFRYDSKSRIRQVTAPVLIIHSPDDDLVPFSHGQALFAAANEPKEFLHLSGSHNEGFLINSDSYDKALTEFIAKYIK